MVARSAPAARPPGRPALRSPPRSSPAGVRAARSAIGRLMLEKGYAVAGAVGSKALRTHWARVSKITAPASCSPGKPTGSQRAGGLRGLSLLPKQLQPKPLHRPCSHSRQPCSFASEPIPPTPNGKGPNPERPVRAGRCGFDPADAPASRDQADGSESSTDTTGRVKKRTPYPPSASYLYVLS